MMSIGLYMVGCYLICGALSWAVTWMLGQIEKAFGDT